MIGRLSIRVDRKTRARRCGGGSCPSTERLVTAALAGRDAGTGPGSDRSTRLRNPVAEVQVNHQICCAALDVYLFF